MESGQQNPSTPNREQYVTQLSEQLQQWDQKVEQITSKSNRSQMDSALLDDLLQKQAAAHSWLSEVKESDNEMWEELKAQASVASQDYQDVLERAAERFKVEGPRHASHPSQRQEGGSGTSGQGGKTGDGNQSSKSGQTSQSTMGGNKTPNESSTGTTGGQSGGGNFGTPKGGQTGGTGGQGRGQSGSTGSGGNKSQDSMSAGGQTGLTGTGAGSGGIGTSGTGGTVGSASGGGGHLGMTSDKKIGTGGQTGGSQSGVNASESVPQNEGEGSENVGRRGETNKRNDTTETADSG